ncbi:MAG: hypothetical protein Q9P44_15190 [Anaerolineae bacterium]|nr:hypothetical protein [Anaerolineae bacterium]
MLILRMMMLLLMVGLSISFLIVLAYTFGQRIGQRKSKHKGGELPSDAGVRDMLFEGRIQEAIAAYRTFTGLDEFAAKKAVDDMLREMRLDDTVRDEVKKLLKLGNKAGAIEAYQTATGTSLAKALEYVESHQGRKK